MGSEARENDHDRGKRMGRRLNVNDAYELLERFDRLKNVPSGTSEFALRLADQLVVDHILLAGEEYPETKLGTTIEQLIQRLRESGRNPILSPAALRYYRELESVIEKTS